ncbi:MAG: response regulator transcription factor [Deltaproteobacteria bacterium]|jgi:DNA-binding response OmpR family regulator|nr:response regulator transcription factor [Deltaproteobacteria bacterium]
MPKRRILVVEDDAAVREGLVDALSFEGYQVLEAGTFKEAVRVGVEAGYDLLMLDLVLPGGDGLDVLAEVRLARPTTPVIILTARGQEQDRVAGLKLGADDYVQKPFSIKELLARVEAVLRRSAERPVDVTMVQFPGGVADLARSQVVLPDGSKVELSEKEVALLRYLAMHPGRVITRDELLARVWRLPSANVRTRTIDMHVVRLREKLGDDAEAPRIIETVRGKGYVFNGEVQRS